MLQQVVSRVSFKIPEGEISRIIGADPKDRLKYILSVGTIDSYSSS